MGRHLNGPRIHRSRTLRAGIMVSPDLAIAPGFFVDRRWSADGMGVRRLHERDIRDIMEWRNSQQAVLRQQSELTVDRQRTWYRTRVVPSYESRQPLEILVVVVDEDDAPVSYGGLTNIEWVSRRAELSFLTATERADDPEQYEVDLRRFLRWVKPFAFREIGLHRLFTETWASRELHLGILQSEGFILEGRMRDHVVKDGLVQDALIHGLLATDAESG